MLDGTPLTPELALVDPELAERARALLPDRPTAAPQEVEIGSRAFSEQQERLEELTALLDEITEGWRHAESRLARLEEVVERRVVAPTVAAPAQPRRAERRFRPRVPATLVLLAAIVAAMAAVELLPSGDRPRLAVVSEAAAPSGDNAEERSDDRDGNGRSAATSSGTARTSEPPAARPRRTGPPASRPSGGSTGPTVPAPPAEPQASTSSPSRTPKAPKSEAGTGRTGAAPPVPPASTSRTQDFKPARVFLWPPVKGATTYAVTFFRDGDTLYSAQVSKPRLALPATIRFSPGSYRWVVRPGSAGKALGAPIVDSTFTIDPR